MTALKLTAAQARRLGIGSDTAAETGDGTRRRRSGGRRRRVPYHTVCADCGEHFTTQAAETRHLDATRHCNYQLVVAFEQNP